MINHIFFIESTKMTDSHHSTNIQVIPNEILIEIFKWIPFDDLHWNIMPVCRSWRKIITSHYCYPRVLLIKNTSKIHRITHLTTEYHQKIVILKILDAFDGWVMACLKRQRWPNLKTLIIQSRWMNLNRGIALNVNDLKYLIDCSPKLRYLKIRECWVDGDMASLFEKIERRKLTKFALLNRYLVIDNTDRLYGLKNMETFQVYCHFFNRNDMATSLDNFISNNKHSLTKLALHVKSSAEMPDGDEIILTKIASSCSRIIKLVLAGQFKISSRGLVQITDALPKLRTLKLEVSPFLSSKVFTEFLRHKSTRKLRSMEVLWHRRVDWSELESMNESCGQHLNKLSLGFWIQDDDFVLEFVTNLMQRSRNLRNLKLLSTDIRFLSRLLTLTSYGNLVYLSFVLRFKACSQTKLENGYVKKYANSLIASSSNFWYESSLSETEFRVTLTKKT